MQGIWVVAFAMQWALLGLLALLVAGVLRYLTSIQELMSQAAPHISKYEIGDVVDHFSLPNLRGQDLNSQQLLRANKVLLFLISAHCTACNSLLMQIAEFTGRGESLQDLGWSIVLIFSGEEAAIKDIVSANQGLQVPGVEILLDTESSVLRRFGARAVPTGIAIDRDGRLLAQSLNPHFNWLYTTLKVLPPVEPIKDTSNGEMEPMVFPTAYVDGAPHQVGPLKTSSGRSSGS